RAPSEPVHTHGFRKIDEPGSLAVDEDVERAQVSMDDPGVGERIDARQYGPEERFGRLEADVVATGCRRLVPNVSHRTAILLPPSHAIRAHAVGSSHSRGATGRSRPGSGHSASWNRWSLRSRSHGRAHVPGRDHAVPGTDRKTRRNVIAGNLLVLRTAGSHRSRRHEPMGANLPDGDP